MRKLITPTSSFLFAVLLLGCRQSQSGSCSSTQANYSGPKNEQDFAGQSPAGGYIQLGNRACTATFLLDSATDSELRVSVFTARHCTREDSLENPETSISVYLPSKDEKTSGYLKNIPVKHEFFERRKAFLAEVAKLNNKAANQLATSSMTISMYSQEELNKPDSTEPLMISSYERCMALTGQEREDNVQKTCWGLTDTTVNEIRIPSASLDKKRYAQLRSHLEESRPRKDQEAAVSERVSRIRGIQSTKRLFQYAFHMGTFLNENLCGSLLAKDDPMQEACIVRQQLMNLAESYLVEVDTDRKSKSVLKKLDEMGLGVKSAFVRPLPNSSANTSVPPTHTTLRDLVRDQFYDNANAILAQMLNDLEKLVERNSEKKIAKFDKSIALATNVNLNSDGQRKTLFTLIRPSALYGTGSSLVSSKLDGGGAFTMVLSEKQSHISFSKTDSGSLLTYGGVIPLAVLHTVDGEPVSGGASILALPEAPPEESTAAAPSVGRGRTVASRPQQDEVNTGVQLKETGAVIARTGSTVICN